MYLPVASHTFWSQVPGDREHQAWRAGREQTQARHPGDRVEDRGLQEGEPRRLQLGDQVIIIIIIKLLLN